MDFSFSDDQAALQSLLEGYFTKAYPFSQSLADRTLDLPHLPPLWNALATELGVLGAGFPPEFGGLEGGLVAQMIIAEALGKALAITPYYSSIAAGCSALLLAGTPLAEKLLEDAATGDAILALAVFEAGRRYNLNPQATLVTQQGDNLLLSGKKILVHDAPHATHLVVTARNGATGALLLLLVETADQAVKQQAYRTLDGQPAADISFEKMAIGPGAILAEAGKAEAILAAMLDNSRLVLAAELLGSLRATLGLTIEYAKQRQQFGVSIASFQVLQHRLVDAYIAIERAAALIHMASLQRQAGAPDLPMLIAAAMVKILQAAQITGPTAVQIHGGMGVSDETPVTHYIRRITALERRLGTIEDHIASFDAIAGGAGQRIAIQDAA